MTTLTMKEEKRLEVIQRVFRGELTVAKAALVLGVSERQCYRIKARVTRRGARGVVHGNRGLPSKHKVKEKTLKRIVADFRGQYTSFQLLADTSRILFGLQQRRKHSILPMPRCTR